MKKPVFGFIDASNLFYGGVELDGFPYSILDKKPIDLIKLIKYLKGKNDDNIKSIARIKFYLKLAQFGYLLQLKPVKIFHEPGGKISKKANCDVDMTFDLMRYLKDYSDVLVLSGDGDFAIVLKYLMKLGRKVTVLARGERTARDIRQLAGKNFRDFNYLRELIKFKV